jgi:hypothetical protein
MWQMDNDRYALWRLEQDLLPKGIDRLIDSVTVADRAEQPVHALPVARRLAAAIRRFARALYHPLPAAPIVRRASE